MHICVIDLWIWICSEMEGSKSWGVKLYIVQVWGSTLDNRRGLATNRCCKSAHVNYANLLLPAALVAKMTNQPLCERETRKAQCRVEIWCCWDCRRLQAPHLCSCGWDGVVRIGGEMVWAAGWLTQWVRDSVFCTARKPGTLEDLTTQISIFLTTWLVLCGFGWPKWLFSFF